VENGYLLTDHQTATKLYYEPHGNHSPSLKDSTPVDVIITPVVDLEIPLLGPIIKGSQSALEVVQWLKPQVLVPTAAGGNVAFEGLLVSVLRAKGSPEQLQLQLDQQQISTQLITPKPGERIDLQPILSRSS
jgi:L-ascorbate metabolism protein UlaG (beta-lactamase superfamily)